MNRKMLNKIISNELDKILKTLFKLDYFSEPDIHKYHAFLKENPSYDEIVNKSYQKYFKKLIDSKENAETE